MPASLARAPLLAASAVLALVACGSSTKQTGAGGGSTSSSSGGGSPPTSTSSSSSSSSTSTSSSSGTGATSFPFPQVVYGGGPTLSAPNVITITFTGNTYATDLASFGASFAGSSYWAAVGADLTCGGSSSCVGPGPAGTAAVSPIAIASSYTDSAGGGAGTLQPFLQSVIAALPSSMAPATNNLYLFYTPSSTTITLDDHVSCQSFGGYHNSMTIGATPVVYAVVPDCGGREKLNAEQALTFDASHEIAEGSSDSIVGTGSLPTGYAVDETVQESYPWLTLGLSEIGDLCVDLLSLNEDITTENNFSVQRIWSPANAATGTMDPCVPSNGEVYFNAFPTVSAVIVDVGQTQTFEIDALALGSEPAWTVVAEDATIFGDYDQYLSFSIAGGTNQGGIGVIAASSGDRFQATVKMLKDPKTAPNSPGWGLGLIVSYAGLNPPASTAGHYWPFLVLTSAEASHFGITMTKDQPHHVAQLRPRLPRPLVHRTVSRTRFLDPLLPLFR